ncbi:MAG: hypothetical protein ACJA0P_003402, partial [Planctomycetota bacterium]
MRSWFFLLGAAFVLALFVLLLRVPPGVAASDVAAVSAGAAGAAQRTAGAPDALPGAASGLGVASDAGPVEVSAPAATRVVGEEGLGRILLTLVDRPE